MHEIFFNPCDTWSIFSPDVLYRKARILHAAEIVFAYLDRRVGVKIAAEAENRPLRHIEALHMRPERVGGDGVDRLDRAEDIAAEHTASPDILIINIGAQILGAVLIHGDLFLDNALLKLDILGGKERMGYHVADNVKRLCHMLGQRRGIEAGKLLRRVGVYNAAYLIHLLGYVERGAALGAPEQHMLNEM